MKMIATALLCLTIAVAAGCKSAPAPAAKPGAAGTAAIAPEAAHGQPTATETVTGTVVETMDAATYTYVRVKTDKGDLWAASSQFKVAVGDKVTVPLEMPMENFHSNALKRDFPVIYFSPRITKDGEAPAPSAMDAAMPPGHNPTGAARATVTELIPQPSGGTAVALLWTNRKALAGKPVTVRGKVVKFNGGILGRNWFHLQDGTGTEAEGTNDITVTSAADTKVGDIVTVTGTLALDKDFGAGYAYAVIIEDAKFLPAR